MEAVCFPSRHHCHITKGLPGPYPIRQLSGTLCHSKWFGEWKQKLNQNAVGVAGNNVIKLIVKEHVQTVLLQYMPFEKHVI
jgi:hypothetical protein